MKLLKSSLAVSMAFTAATMSPVTLAEDDASSVERITVRGAYFGVQDSSSVKTPTALINVPQSLSVMSAEQIEDQAFTSVADVIQYMPGVSMGLGEDHRDQITIRGQNTTADFFIDGLRDDVQYFRPLYNLERVEVLRGANALLFGRGGGGGVVNRVTKEAKLGETFTTLNASLDTFGAGLFAVDHNSSIDEQQSVRINAMFETIDSHRDFKDGERYAFNPTYTYQVNADTKIVASWEYVEDDRVTDRGIPSLSGTNAPAPGMEDTYFGAPDFNRTTFEGNILRTRVDHQLNDSWSVNGTLQYADYDKTYQNLYPVFFDGTNVTLDGYRDTTRRENLILQFNAIGQINTGSIEHTILLGAEYGNQDTENDRRDALFLDNYDDQNTFIFSDPLMIPEFGLDVLGRDRASDVTFSSAFVQDEIELNSWLILVAGLRYDNFDIDVQDRAAIRAGEQGDFTSSDSEVSPRIGVIYKPAEELSFYASFSKSFLPRSGDQFLTLSLSSAALDAEEFENREIGAKWNLNDALSLTAAVFEVERENGTVTDPDNAERSLLTGTETKGFELQLVGQLADNWSINAGYSHLSGEEMGRVSGGVVANRDLAQLPETMITLWSQYDWTDALSFGLGIVHQSEQYASLNNTVELPDFTRVDFAVYYDVSENLSLQLNIENLLDEEYYPSAHNDNNIAVGEPVNARLGLRYQF